VDKVVGTLGTNRHAGQAIHADEVFGTFGLNRYASHTIHVSQAIGPVDVSRPAGQQMTGDQGIKLSRVIRRAANESILNVDGYLSPSRRPCCGPPISARRVYGLIYSGKSLLWVVLSRAEY
jgi:hypothetical protein